jgi:predicted ATP-grasp superfamily ATP-dependent carboligase
VRQYRIPAVVVGLNPTALGVVRSLTDHCLNVVALESNREEPGTRTRLATVRLVEDLSDHEALLGELVSVAQACDERPVLFLSTDEHVIWAVENRALLEHYYRLVLPSREVCDALMYKDRFLTLAAREGYPVPASAFLPVEDLPRHIEVVGLRYPVILKPANKAGRWERDGLDKAYIVCGPAEAAEVAARAGQVVPSLLVQEYVAGDDAQVYFCLYFAHAELGDPLLFCGRKLLQWPPLRGSTAACEPAFAPDLVGFTEALFGQMGVSGFASLEVKYDGGGGFKIIEPTIGRVDLQSYLATLNGMNMPLAAYLIAIGCPHEARAFAHRTRSDVAWVYETSLWALVRAHAIGGPALLDLARRPKGYALASWADPGVLGAFAGDKLERAARKMRALVTF